MAKVQVGIIGFGTVGAGTYEVLTANREIIQGQIGAEVRVKRIADLDIDSDRGVAVDSALLTREAMEVIEDPEIDIVVELMGGLDKAKEYLLAAIERGKHVVTANKALLAESGRELFEAADRHRVNLGFEASVGGGIPVIGALRTGLAANRIQSMLGILNGTSNYILTRMTQVGVPYDEAVEEAVRRGFAEDPPTLDVDGTDAAHKLAILISIAFGSSCPFNQIYREGIHALSPDDIRFAGEFGYHVKLLAIARNLGDRVEARVHPAMIPKDHILANVNGSYNALYLEGDFVGPNLYYGLGAGRNPTGSAVASDIIALARQITLGIPGLWPPLAHTPRNECEVRVDSIENLRTSYYFRFSALDRPGVLSKISGILGEHGISISSVIQKGREINGSVPVVMLTHEAKEKNVLSALSLIKGLDVVTGTTAMIRVETRDQRLETGEDVDGRYRGANDG